MYPERFQLVDWAFRESIKGNKPAVENARRILLFMATLCELDDCGDSMRYRINVSVSYLVGRLYMPERSVYRALKRLEECNLIEPTMDGSRHCWRVLFRWT